MSKYTLGQLVMHYYSQSGSNNKNQQQQSFEMFLAQQSKRLSFLEDSLNNDLFLQRKADQKNPYLDTGDLDGAACEDMPAE
jgi:hypothetical protein